MRTMYDDPPGRRVPLLLAFELWRQKEAMTTLNSVVREVRPSTGMQCILVYHGMTCDEEVTRDEEFEVTLFFAL